MADYFHILLRDARLRAGLSRQELADIFWKAGYKRVTYSILVAWESPTVKSVPRSEQRLYAFSNLFRDVLNLSLNDLLEARDFTMSHRDRIYQSGKTHCAQRHEYTDENTSFHKDGSRRCLTCHRSNEKRRQNKRSRDNVCVTSKCDNVAFLTSGLCNPCDRRLKLYGDVLINNSKTGTGKSKYIGVNWYSAGFRNQPWMARIGINGNEYFLGYFYTEEDAAHAYDNALAEYITNGGSPRKFNFPDEHRNSDG